MAQALTHKAKLLWILAFSMLILGSFVYIYDPVSMSFKWEFGRVLSWPDHAPNTLSYSRDNFMAAILIGCCAWYATSCTTKPHGIAAGLTFILMSQNIALGLRELTMIAKDPFGDYQHLWLLCILHWLTGLLNLGCLMPLLLWLRARPMAPPQG